MNGFIVIGYNNNSQDKILFDNLESYLKTRNESFSSNQLKSDLFNNLIGYQIFNRNTKIEYTNNTNTYLNGKIFGHITDNSTKKLSYNESLEFISTNINKNNDFFGFDGSCSLVKVEGSSIIFQNDIEGYKKIFYYDTGDIFCISTNLTYIIRVIKNQWKIRKNAVFSYILQRESKWPLSFIEGIKMLPPLTKAIRADGGITQKSAILSDFYKLQKVKKEDVIEDVYASYERIIKRENSKNIAVTLSGGYDSNCLTKLYSQSYNHNFTAVSLGYASQREKDVNVYDETIYAEKIAKHLKIPFKKYIVDKSYFLSQVDNFIKTLDQPGHDPSSNFLLNDLLEKDGYDTVVSGMGGDAFFSSKSNLELTKLIFNLAHKTHSYKYLNLISKQLKFKWILKAFDTRYFLQKPSSFNELRELQKLNKANLNNFIDRSIKKELFEETKERFEYYNKIDNKSNTQLEEFYSYALLSNPDEYHADIMAQRNNLNIIMPFININPVLKLLNASEFININNRDFEMELFGGINKELLLKSKSGFSFPYTEWAGEYFEETISFFKDAQYFNEGIFLINKFDEMYRNDINVKNNLSANQLIWKLTVVKKFAEYHHLDFNNQ